MVKEGRSTVLRVYDVHVDLAIGIRERDDKNYV